MVQNVVCKWSHIDEPYVLKTFIFHIKLHFLEKKKEKKRRICRQYLWY